MKIKFYITGWFRNKEGKKEQGKVLKVNVNNWKSKARIIKKDLEVNTITIYLHLQLPGRSSNPWDDLVFFQFGEIHGPA